VAESADSPKTAAHEPPPTPTQHKPAPSAHRAPSGGGSRFALFGGIGTLFGLLILGASVIGVGALYLLRPAGTDANPHDIAQVQAAVQEQATSLSRCATSSRRGRGEIVFDFVIAEGKVQSVGLVSSTIERSSVEECLRDGVMSMRFPGIEAMRVRSPLKL